MIPGRGLTEDGEEIWSTSLTRDAYAKSDFALVRVEPVSFEHGAAEDDLIAVLNDPEYFKISMFLGGSIVKVTRKV